MPQLQVGTTERGMARAQIVTVRLTPEQYEWLQGAAEEIEESLSWVLRDLIDQARRDDDE